MPRLDSYEAAIIAQCRAGIKYPNGGGTGPFCKKPDLCRREGRCHFVAQAERHLERVWSKPLSGRIVWSRGFDYEEHESMPMFGTAW